MPTASAKVVHRGPWTIPVAVTGCLCPDGRRRRARITGEADTFFTIPASVHYRGKTVSGWVSHLTAYSCPCGNTWVNREDERCRKCGAGRDAFESQDDMEFFPSLGSKNGAMFSEKGFPS